MLLFNGRSFALLNVCFIFWFYFQQNERQQINVKRLKNNPCKIKTRQLLVSVFVPRSIV